MYVCFCAALLCRVCVTAAYFSGFRVGRVQSGFNHKKISWPHTRIEKGGNSWHIWDVRRNISRRMSRRLLTSHCRERCTFEGQGWKVGVGGVGGDNQCLRFNGNLKRKKTTTLKLFLFCFSSPPPSQSEYLTHLNESTKAASV